MRRGSTSSVRYRRAMMLLASAGGNRVPVIAQLVQADEDTVRDVIHRFNEIGPACLEPQWAGGRPRLLSREDEDFVIRTATTRPTLIATPSSTGLSRCWTASRTSPGPWGSGPPRAPAGRNRASQTGRRRPTAALTASTDVARAPPTPWPRRGPLLPAAAVHAGQLPPPQPPSAEGGKFRTVRSPPRRR